MPKAMKSKMIRAAVVVLPSENNRPIGHHGDLYDFKLALTQRFDISPVKWMVDIAFSTVSSGAIVRIQSNTVLFTKEETFWLPMIHRRDCWGCRSDYFQTRDERTQMLQIFRKLQCLTSTPKTRTMTGTRFMTTVHPQVGPREGKLEIIAKCKVKQKQTDVIFADCTLPTIADISESSFQVSLYAVRNISYTSCQPWFRYIRIPLRLIF